MTLTIRDLYDVICYKVEVLKIRMLYVQEKPVIKGGMSLCFEINLSLSKILKLLVLFLIPKKDILKTWLHVSVMCLINSMVLFLYSVGLLKLSYN